MHSLVLELDAVRNQLTGFCNEIAADGRSGMSAAQRALDQFRTSSPNAWREFCDIARKHKIFDILQGDPFTHHAYSRPRGYPGDAPLLDKIYYPEQIYAGLDPVSLGICGYSTNVSACRGVRIRRSILAQFVDQTANTRSGARILTIACGHLREAELSASLHAGALEQWLAIDQDAQSLAELERCYGKYPAIKPMCKGLKELISGGVELGDGYDLIYAAGLYDYLDQPTGQFATAYMFSKLRPGGKVLVANFIPDIQSIGYMECFMRWYLIYRDEPAMIDLATTIDTNEIAAMRTFREPDDNIIFLEIQKN